MYIVLHVKYQLLLSYFNETRISWKNFREIFKFHENLSSGENLSMRTDRHDEAYSLFLRARYCERPYKKGAKGKKSLLTPQRRIGGVDIKLHSFLTLTLNGGMWSISGFGRFKLGK